MVRKPKSTKTSRKDDRRAQLAKERSQAELRKAQSLIARERRKEEKKQQEGTDSIHSGDGKTPRRESRRLRQLRDAKEAQAKLKLLQQQHKKEMEGIDKMKEAIEKLDQLTKDKPQANVITVSGGSSDSETETEDRKILLPKIVSMNASRKAFLTVMTIKSLLRMMWLTTLLCSLLHLNHPNLKLLLMMMF